MSDPYRAFSWLTNRGGQWQPRKFLPSIKVGVQPRAGAVLGKEVCRIKRIASSLQKYQILFASAQCWGFGDIHIELDLLNTHWFFHTTQGENNKQNYSGYTYNGNKLSKLVFI